MMANSPLNSPASIAGLTLKNRLVFPPLLVNMATDRGEVTPRMVEFMAARARGGAALVMSEACYIKANGGISTRGIGVYDDRFIAGLSELASAVHADGAAIGLQIFYNGAGRGFAGSKSTSVGPSDLSDFGGPQSKELSLAEIGEMRRLFIGAAYRAQVAGFDLVEVHIGHAHLLGRFASPYWNRRSDEYGGSWERRLQLPVEVISGITERCPDLPVTVRFSIDEMIPGGIAPPLSFKIAKRLQEAGVSAFHVSNGSGTTPSGLASIFPSSYREEVPFADAIGAFCAEVDVPVIAAGGVRSKAAAESLLQMGASFISAGRAMLADSDVAGHWLGERTGEIRECIACNQGCADSLVRREEITCLVNPWVGAESVLDAASHTSPSGKNSGAPSGLETRQAHSFDPKAGSRHTGGPSRVAVVGGGPAGMTAAINAAAVGHHVTLFESADELGGQFRHAELWPGKSSFSKYVSWAISELHRLGVEIALKTFIHQEDQVADYPIVLGAVGALPQLGNWTTGFETTIHKGWEVFDNPPAVREGCVVIVGAGMVAVDLALWMSNIGAREVKLLNFDSVGSLAFGPTTEADRETFLQRAGIRPLIVSAISEEGEGQLLVNPPAGGPIQLSNVDCVIDATHVVPVALPFDCTARIGDCLTVAGALEAIRQGAHLGRSLQHLGQQVP